jgi:aminoglycoside 2''-phosphotransferase
MAEDLVRQMQPDWQRIEREHEGLRIESSRFLGEGWNSQVYLVNDELVFRFPKRRENWEEMRREIAFLTFAADHLSLAVPRYIIAAPESTAAKCGYAVYQYLPGHELDLRTLTQKQQDAAAETLATFLRELHQLKLSPQIEALLPTEDARHNAEEYLQAAIEEIIPQLTASEAESLLALFEGYLSGPENFTFQPAVLHADLSGDHILTEGGAVVAVIDFGDLNLGDPDYDFMYLFDHFGEEFALSVARRYGHSDLEGLPSKLRYYAAVDHIGTILYGEGLALWGQEDRAWRRLKQIIQYSDGV